MIDIHDILAVYRCRRQVAANLALQYNFSGGQIENIARKSTIENIIHGIEPSLDKLKEFCDTELIGRENNGSRIGFRA